MHHSFSVLGRKLAEGWGTSSREPLIEILSQMANDRILVCLLAAAVDELIDIRKQLAEKQKDTPRGDVSDGMLKAWRPTPQPFKTVSLANLSVRAKKTLSRLGIKSIEDITRERLVRVRGCGQTTINELMALKEMHFPPPDIPEPIPEIDPIVGSSIPMAFHGPDLTQQFGPSDCVELT